MAKAEVIIVLVHYKERGCLLGEGNAANTHGDDGFMSLCTRIFHNLPIFRIS